MLDLIDARHPLLVAQFGTVEKVVPILSQFAILDLHDKKVPVYLVGYEPKIGGGPWHFYNDNGSYNKGIWVGKNAVDKPISRRPLP